MTPTFTHLVFRSGPPRLMGHSAVVFRDSMLLFGGGECQNFPKNGLWRYSFSTQSWVQVASLPGSNTPAKIHHCCTGLGPSYAHTSCCSSSEHEPRQENKKARPFMNKCFPAPLTLDSEGDIELKTFSPERKRLGSSEPDPSNRTETGPQPRGSRLTFENKASKKRWSCTEEHLLDQEEDEDIRKHLPDTLLVLGGRPYSTSSPLSIWQMTLTDP